MEYQFKPTIKFCRLGLGDWFTRLQSNRKNFGDRRQLTDAVRNHLARALAQAQSEGAFEAGLDPENLAVSLTALIQGGYVLARTLRDETLMRRAAEGALALISELSRAVSHWKNFLYLLVINAS
jgi:hypothetical protein